MKLIGKNIFIVEDNTMNRVIYQISLGKSGAFLEFDRWGRDTLDKMKYMKLIDLIILDLMLPQGESGFAIFERIRRIPKYTNVPIVAVSASEPAVAIPKAQELGFSGFIAKPINPELFPEQISQLLQGQELWITGTQ